MKEESCLHADNQTSDTSKFDFSAVVEDFGVDILDDWDFVVDIEEKDFASKNKEIDFDEIEEKYKIILEYSSEDYLRVNEALARIASSPERAVYQMLFGHE